jgi:hypothetical protein
MLNFDLAAFRAFLKPPSAGPFPPWLRFSMLGPLDRADGRPCGCIPRPWVHSSLLTESGVGASALNQWLMLAALFLMSQSDYVPSGNWLRYGFSFYHLRCIITTSTC